jgi:hypothetical protein
VQPDFQQLICGIDPGWPHLQKFTAIFERAIKQFGTHRLLYYGVTRFLSRGGGDLLPEPALAYLVEIVRAKKQDAEFWQANGENTVSVLKGLIVNKSSALAGEHRNAVTLIADILVDNGVRGAGFLQQELLRSLSKSELS